MVDIFKDEAPSGPAVPAASVQPTSGGDIFSGAVSEPAAATPATPGRSYLENIMDYPSDVAQIAGEGIEATTSAPSKIVGTAENRWKDLVPKMIEMGMPPERAEEMARKMQRNEGFLGLAMGPLQALTSPIWGGLRSLVSRPLEEKVGIPKEATELGVSTILGRPKMAAGVPRTPLASALRTASDEGYTVARSLPITMKPEFAPRAADVVEMTLEQRYGYRPNVAKGTYRALDYLRSLPEERGELSIADIDSIRQNLGHVAREVDARGLRTSDAGAASHAIEALDEVITGMKPGDIARGAHLHGDLIKELSTARANYAAYVRAKIIEDAIDRAERQAARSGSGTNIENAIRQRFDAIINNKKEFQRYSPNEQAAIREIVKPTTGGRDAARYVGKLAPTGIVSTAGSVGLGALVGGTTGMEALPIIGLAAKKIADFKARKAAEGVSEIVRKRSPLFLEAEKAAVPYVRSRIWPYSQLSNPRNNEENP